MSTASEPATEKGGHDFRSHLISGPRSRGFQITLWEEEEKLKIY